MCSAAVVFSSLKQQQQITIVYSNEQGHVFVLQTRYCGCEELPLTVSTMTGVRVLHKSQQTQELLSLDLDVALPFVVYNGWVDLEIGPHPFKTVCDGCLLMSVFSMNKVLQYFGDLITANDEAPLYSSCSL